MRLVAASILWCICTFAQTPGLKPDDKCSVEGTVVNSATGEPIRKARVTLAPFGRDEHAFASIRLGERDVLEMGFDFTPGTKDVLTVVLNPNGGQIEGLAKNAKDGPGG